MGFFDAFKKQPKNQEPRPVEKKEVERPYMGDFLHKHWYLGMVKMIVLELIELQIEKYQEEQTIAK